MDRDVVLVEGPEAAAYLHGQVSQDVLAVDVGASVLSFLLEPRGPVECLFRLTRVDQERFVLDTDPGGGELLASSLNRFKLRTKAEIELARWQMATIRGAGAADIDLSGVDGAEVVAWPWDGNGVDLIGPAIEAPAGLMVGSVEEFDADRCQHGLPAMGSDVQVGDIPNETGLVSLAVSFTKGCYRGQELVERIDARTGGRRALVRFRTTGVVAPGDRLYGPVGDEPRSEVGAIRSSFVVGGQSGERVGFAVVSGGNQALVSADGATVTIAPVGRS